MRVRFETVSFQTRIVVVIVSPLGLLMTSSLSWEVMTSMAAMKRSAMMDTPRNIGLGVVRASVHRKAAATETSPNQQQADDPGFTGLEPSMHPPSSQSSAQDGNGEDGKRRRKRETKNFKLCRISSMYMEGSQLCNA
ncbi:hypothetical protein EYF80_024158 [Liparis tanakae]|uniref:Uncharacterized protein n=1 Tax=Liparis tanakae TaxID=230148 RepID=A0A4Z2HI92_9TELE|nr:hypothetical protein EYF80_024158 [Liparis tanakae]